MARSGQPIRVAGVLGVITAGLLLAGCAPGSNKTQRPGPPARSAATLPTATALMICGPDIGGKISQVVKLTAPARKRSSFSGDRYTCTYQLPVGPLTLSVQHSTTSATANVYFDSLKARTAAADDLLGLGERAFGTPDGTAVVIKDNETLTVDATRLPAVFGVDRQKRTDLANEIASDVLGCWTGDGDE
jgi:hypothetical protein